jgi:hypothetical protein
MEKRPVSSSVGLSERVKASNWQKVSSVFLTSSGSMLIQSRRLYILFALEAINSSLTCGPLPIIASIRNCNLDLSSSKSL